MRQNLDGLGRFGRTFAVFYFFLFFFSSDSHAGVEKNVLPKCKCWIVKKLTSMDHFPSHHDPGWMIIFSPTPKKVGFFGEGSPYITFFERSLLDKHIILDTPTAWFFSLANFRSQLLKRWAKKGSFETQIGPKRRWERLRFLNGLRMVQAMFKSMTISMTFGNLRLGVTHGIWHLWSPCENL